MKCICTNIVLDLVILTFIALSYTNGKIESIRKHAPEEYKEKLLYLHIWKNAFTSHYYDFLELNHTLALPSLQGVVAHKGLRDLSTFLSRISTAQLKNITELYDLSDTPAHEDISIALNSDNDASHFKEYITKFIDVLKKLRSNYDSDLIYQRNEENGQIHCPCYLCVRDDIVCVAVEKTILSLLAA